MIRDGEDAKTIRTFGSVLIGIGLVAVLVAMWWNGRSDEFDRDSLVPTVATAVAYETRTIKTKTSNEEWIVVDVRREIDGASASESWAFPAHSATIEAGLARLEVPSTVSGLLVEDPVFVRWDDEAIRLVWAISAGGETLVPYELVHEVEARGRYASPMIGIVTIGMGIGLLLISRESRRDGAAESPGT